ncbi:MAG TPA: toprim domain-containing protein, partial [Gemmatimonadaceae bacterium]|nr:toprim domain-containing protein [Gemmatimonadaceae bacterium]
MATRKTTTKRPAAKKPKATTPKSAAKTSRAVKKTATRGRTAVADYEDGEVGTGTAAREGGTLVIVESPAKAKTIGKYLGRGYRVQATVGHIMDLPEKKLGIDVENGFEPDLVPIPG